VEPPVDENLARSASPNLLSWLPGLRRGRDDESIPTITQELPPPPPPPPPTTTQPARPPVDENPPTPAPPIAPSEEASPVNGPQPDVDPLPPSPPPPSQQPPDHPESMSTPELPPSPPTTESALQVTPQDTTAAEPPSEAGQEPNRQPTPPPLAREVSPTPQKVKTSFKAFLMRKKKEKVESPVIPSSTTLMSGPTPTVPSVPGRGSDPVVDLSEETRDPVERQSSPSPDEPSGPSTAELSDVDMDTSSPAPEPEPAKVKLEITQPPQPKPDCPSESWLDSQILRPGVVVDLLQDSAQDWVHGEFIGVHGVVESVVRVPDRPPAAWFKPIDGGAHAIVIPVTMMIPVRPSEEGEVVIVLSGQHKGKVGMVVRLEKDTASVDLDGPETVVADVEPPWLCLFLREDRTPLPNPTPPPPPVSSEKGDSMSPPPAPQSEDGEILQDSPPRSQSQPPGNSSFPQGTTPLRAAPINPPTQPRSFQNAWKNNTSTIPPRTNPYLINANPNGSISNNSNNLSNTFANSPIRPSPPSGPKALRGLNSRSPFEGSRFKSGVMGSGLNGNGLSGLTGINGNGMGAGLKRELNPNNGHPAIPKGPSADRERERERANGSWSTKNWGSGWR
jgi:hypothetical protein